MADAESISRKGELPPVFGGGEFVARETPFPGVSRASYRTPKASLAAYIFEPGASFPMHRHDEEQLTVILAGDVEFTVGDAVHKLSAGETFVASGGVPHGLQAGAAGARFIAIIVPPRTRPDAYAIEES